MSGNLGKMAQMQVIQMKRWKMKRGKAVPGGKLPNAIWQKTLEKEGGDDIFHIFSPVGPKNCLYLAKKPLFG